MTIRKKIFLLAGILLALFGIVVGVLAAVQKMDADAIGNIADYELPLSGLLAEFDVDTFRYELDILRLLRLDSLNPAQLQVADAAKRQTADEMRADVNAAAALMERAIHDRAY